MPGNCNGKNIELIGVGSMCCTWSCTDDVVGVTVPHAQFSISHFGEEVQNCKF